MEVPEKTLTSKQKKVLEAIRKLTRIEGGVPPTLRELAEELGFRNPSGPVSGLEALAANGKITWTKGKSRSIRIVGPNPCPHCGKDLNEKPA